MANNHNSCIHVASIFIACHRPHLATPTRQHRHHAYTPPPAVPATLCLLSACLPPLGGAGIHAAT